MQNMSARGVAPKTPLRKARLDSGMTLPELATKAGISKGQLSQIETGKGHTTAQTAARLAEALGRERVTEEQILYPERFMTS